MHLDYSDSTSERLAARLEAGIARCNRIVDAIVATSPRPGTFETVLLPLEAITIERNETFALTAFLAEVGDEAQREAGRAASERLGKWDVELTERDDLAAAVLRYAQTDDAAGLDPVRARLLADRLETVRASGHELAVAERAQLGVLRRRLVELESAFEEHIAAPSEPLVVSAAELEGLPASFTADLEAGPDADSRLVPITPPAVWAVIEGAPCRALRERVMRAWNTRAVPANVTVLTEMLAVRRRIAALLGYRSWAEYRLARRMAGSPERVEAFFEELRPGLLRLGRAEAARLRALLVADTGDEVLQAWDFFYYDAMLRRTEHGIDGEAVSAYFPIEAVLEGFFATTGELFGIAYTPIPADGAWHSDVRRYAITDAASGEELGIVDMDLHPRPGKFSHAAAYGLRRTYRDEAGQRVPAYVAIMANLPSPAAGRPALLRFDDVQTLFHEMGHVLHGCLSQAEFCSQSGTSVVRDFVEAPSQILENLLREPTVLRRFARHYETGEPIPNALVRGLVDAAELNVGLRLLRQLFLARVDMALHGRDEVADIVGLSRSLSVDTLRAYPEGTFEFASFGHLAGYDAGYYGYLWSKVRGDDMWSRFAESGLDPAVGAAYRREILEPGDSRDANDLLRAFLGHEPSIEPFLRLRGLAA